MLTRRPAREAVTKVRPSEAIRLGVVVAPRMVKGHLFDDGGACALGAMAIGLGFVDALADLGSRTNDEELVEAIARTLPPQLPHPLCYRLMGPVAVVASLNDDFGWSRERVATWLELWGC